MADRHEFFDNLTQDELRQSFAAQEYVAEERILTTVYLALKLGKPLLVEGEPGSGKTELGKVLANGFDTDLIRLQCYEGLAAEHALYEWNYTKQLLAVQGDGSPVDNEYGVFGDEYLLARPLLKALQHDEAVPPVLLIDEVDRADEEFEAFLLEILSEYQVSIPEYGTVSAASPPIVVITSNRMRALSDALKRRCIYLHVEPPSFEKEFEIVRRKVPQLDVAVAAEVCGIVQALREEAFLKRPGIAETLDWAQAIAALRETADGSIDSTDIEQTIGILLKEAEDVQRIDTEVLSRLEAEARDARLLAEK